MYDQIDERGVPISRGVPQAVRYAAVIGLILNFAMGYLTVIQSTYGHLWPADKVLRMDLNSYK